MKDILKKIDTYKREVISLQENMIKLPAISPEFGGMGEYDKAAFLENELRKLSFDQITRMDARDPKAKNGIRPSLAAVYKGKDTSKTIWLLAHTDIVPVAILKLWKTEPFKAVVKGDKIYGRGSEDNHQGLVSCWLAVKAFMDLKERPPFNVGLMLIADEEFGSEHGILNVLKKHGKMFGKKDVFVVPDSLTKEGLQVEIAEKSLIWLKVVTKGAPAHGAYPNRGNNAVYPAALALVALREGLHKKFNKKDKLFSPDHSTFEPTKREPNVKTVNNIPAEDVFYMDCRFLPVYRGADILKEAARLVAPVAKKLKVEIEVSALRNEFAPGTRADSQVAKAMLGAIRKVRGGKPYVYGAGGQTVASPLRAAGYDCVVMGKGDGLLHQPNEYSKISNTLSDAKVIATMIKEYK
jgi:succinyl-diaminopimelate desuccinylase